MKLHGILVLSASALSLAATGCGRTSQIICPWAEGGGTDQITRYMANALEEETGNRFIAVNKTGGSGATGHQAGANARPDGRTVTMITVELNTMHQLGVTELTYEDFRPLIQLNADPAAVIVLNDAPWNELGEFLDHIRAHPKQVKMSGTATTGIWDLARVGLLKTAGIDHEDVIWVPSKGAAPSIAELLGGHVDAVCCSVPEAAPQIEAGKLRVLAVLAEEPLAEYPDFPTAKAQGVDWSAVGWRGLAVPQGTPDKIFNQLAESCDKIVESDSFKKFMKTNGFRIEIRGPDEFAKFLAQQDKQWQPVIATYQGK